MIANGARIKCNMIDPSLYAVKYNHHGLGMIVSGLYSLYLVKHDSNGSELSACDRIIQEQSREIETGSLFFVNTRVRVKKNQSITHPFVFERKPLTHTITRTTVQFSL